MPSSLTMTITIYKYSMQLYKLICEHSHLFLIFCALQSTTVRARKKTWIPKLVAPEENLLVLNNRRGLFWSALYLKAGIKEALLTWTVSSQPPDSNSWSWPGVNCTLNTRLMWPSITRCDELLNNIVVCSK